MCPEGGCHFSVKFSTARQNNPREMLKLVGAKGENIPLDNIPRDLMWVIFLRIVVIHLGGRYTDTLDRDILQHLDKSVRAITTTEDFNKTRVAMRHSFRYHKGRNYFNVNGDGMLTVKSHCC
jgi:hypothetical protein